MMEPKVSLKIGWKKVEVDRMYGWERYTLEILHKILTNFNYANVPKKKSPR